MGVYYLVYNLKNVSYWVRFLMVLHKRHTNSDLVFLWVSCEFMEEIGSCSSFSLKSYMVSEPGWKIWAVLAFISKEIQRKSLSKHPQTPKHSFSFLFRKISHSWLLNLSFWLLYSLGYLFSKSWLLILSFWLQILLWTFLVLEGATQCLKLEPMAIKLWRPQGCSF